MKIAIAGLILLLGLQSSQVKAESFSGIAWEIHVMTEKIVSEVHNTTETNKVCTKTYRLSLLDETGLVKGIRDIAYANYILLKGQSYTFEIQKKNFPQPESFSFGEIIGEEDIACREYDFNEYNITTLAIEGALKNSDLESAGLFSSYQPLRRQQTLKWYRSNVINVSNSLFNIENIQDYLVAFHFETEKTTLTINESLKSPEECKERQSLKCGKTYLSKRTSLCGLERINTETRHVCDCAEEVKLPGYPPRTWCNRYHNCRDEVTKTPVYKECVHPSHGVSEVKSCFLKILNNGAYESCIPEQK